MFVQEQLSPPWVCDNVLWDLRSQQRLCTTSHHCEHEAGAASFLPLLERRQGVGRWGL